MGRKTFLSIGKPLPGRTNIVVSRNPGFTGAGIVVAADLDFAMDVARGDALRRGVNEIAVIGGADIFTRLMPLADRLEITHVHARPEATRTFRRLMRHNGAPSSKASFRPGRGTRHR